jgi:hypothetical protein
MESFFFSSLKAERIGRKCLLDTGRRQSGVFGHIERFYSAIASALPPATSPG